MLSFFGHEVLGGLFFLQMFLKAFFVAEIAAVSVKPFYAL
jgi:hypothetical protein